MKKISFLLFALFIFISISKAQDQSQQNTPQVTAMAFTYDDQKMVSGCEDGTIQVWNGEGKLVLTTHIVDPSDKLIKNLKVTNIQVSQDGSRIIAGLYDYGNYYFLLDNKGNTLKSLSSGDYASFSSDCKYIFIARREYQKVFCFDMNGNQVYDLNVKPHYKNSKGEDPNIRIDGMTPTQDGGMYILTQQTINQKKELYDYWIYEYNASKELINKVQIPFSQKIFIAYFNSTPNGDKAFIHGWCNVKDGMLYESFIYKYPGDVSPSPIRSNYDFYYSKDGKILVEKGYQRVEQYSIPNLQSGENFFISGDRQKVVVAYKGKPLEMHSIKEQKKLFDFDNSKTVEDTYVYNAPTQQKTFENNQTKANPKFDLSGFIGLKAGNSVEYGNQFDVDFDRGYGGTTVWKISGVSNSDIAAQGIANFITMHNLAFEAKLKFTIADVSSRHTDYVSINFWIRKIPNDSKGRYESYSVRAYQDGWVQLVHLEKSSEVVVASKNLIEKITFKTWVYTNMTVKTSANGNVEVYINDGYNPVISTNVSIADDGRTSELTVLKSSSAGLPQDLHVTGDKIVRSNSSAETSSGSNLTSEASNISSKTLETKLKDCIAGDCFDGFGYYISNESTEYIGYFSNGVKKGIGQLHLASDNALYNGFFDNDQPNGYGNLSYYTNQIVEVGTFINTQQEGKFFVYKNGNVKTGLYQGNNITDAEIKSECLSGDCENGVGVYQMSNGNHYEGTFTKGRFSKGIKFDGKDYVYQYDNYNADGTFSGTTDILKTNGEFIHCNYVDGRKNGYGIIKSPLNAKSLCAEGTFENGIGTKITVLFRDGRKWVGKQDDAIAPWGTGVGIMSYPDGTTKTGKFKDGEFVSE